MRERDELVGQLGSKEVFLLENKYHNACLEELVLNEREIDQIVEKKNQLIRKYKPIYMNPTSVKGRAHFYAPVKIIGNRSFDTLWFNIIVIWISSFILYLILYFDLIRKIVTSIENVRVRKPDNE